MHVFGNSVPRHSVRKTNKRKRWKKKGSFRKLPKRSHRLPENDNEVDSRHLAVTTSEPISITEVSGAIFSKLYRTITMNKMVFLN